MAHNTSIYLNARLTSRIYRPGHLLYVFLTCSLSRFARRAVKSKGFPFMWSILTRSWSTLTIHVGQLATRSTLKFHLWWCLLLHHLIKIYLSELSQPPLFLCATLQCGCLFGNHSSFIVTVVPWNKNLSWSCDKLISWVLISWHCVCKSNFEEHLESHAVCLQASKGVVTPTRAHKNGRLE